MGALVLALALSTGVAAYTYVHAFSAPFPGVDRGGLVRLVGVTQDDPNQDLSYLDFLDYAQSASGFVELAAAQPYYAASVRFESSTEVAYLEAVSGGLFSVLGARARLGRGLRKSDDQPGAPAAAVISSAWWQRSFGSDPSVIGRTIYLNFRPFTVVGVAAQEFLGVNADSRPDVWIPFAPFRDRYTSWAARADDRDAPLVRVFGRLAPGVGREAAQTVLDEIASRLDASYPRTTPPRLVQLGDATWIDPSIRLAEQPTIRLMRLATAILLLLACANVANLMLSLGLDRRREIALRTALGASPLRLAGRALIDILLLAAVAGVAALVLAAPISARLGSYFARPGVWNMDVARETPMDISVVAFALGLSLATGLLAGLLPAAQALRSNLVEMLNRDSGSGGGAPRRARKVRLPTIHDLLVSTQAGLAVILLVVAGLVLRTLVKTEGIDPGFSYGSLVVTHISTSSTTLEVAERDRFFRELAQRLADEPWVRAATVTDFPLLSPHRQTEMRLDGADRAERLVYSLVVPGFFEALGIDVRRGRSFTDHDEAGAPDVVVINEALARQYFGDREAVGHRIWQPGSDGAPEKPFEIVGVVADTKTQDLLAPAEPTVYFSYPQRAYPSGSALIVSVTGDASLAAPRIERWLRDYEPHLAILNVVPYTRLVRGVLFSQRMNAEMFSGLAALGLVLAVAGVFGVVAVAVRRRTREIGIRMAIGARGAQIVRATVSRALLPVGLGVAGGLAVALALVELVRSLLFGVEPTDPAALAGGIAVLLVATLLASWLPARRAARVDPSRALRHD